MRQKPVLTLVPRSEQPLSYEEHLADVRGMVWNSITDTGQSWKDLADKTGLSYATVSNFADGTTKWPRYSTVVALLQAVNIDQRYVPSGSRVQPDQISVKAPPVLSSLELRRLMRKARFRRR